MNNEQKHRAAIFNEWAKRYADDPDSFSKILGEDGRPVIDYGECCALYYETIANEIAFKEGGLNAA